MLAYVFPGQGSQFPGMGKALAAEYAVARETFDAADAAVEFGLSALCFDGTAAELARTENAQPAILATSVAAYRVLVQQTGCAPLVVAGHSLGEITAHVCAGTLDFDTALRVVRRRGELMQAAVPRGEGAMVAVLGLAAAEVDEICSVAAQSDVVAVANYNGAGQLVVSGHAGALARVRQLATEAGALTRELDVSAPFHCPLMAPAAASLRSELARTTFGRPRIPVVDGTSGQWDGGETDPVELLSAQVCAPVRWDAVMGGLAARGVRYVIEVGPGARLTSMLRRTHKDIRAGQVGEPSDLEAVAEMLAELPQLRRPLGYWRYGSEGDLIASDASEIVWAATGALEPVTEAGWTTRPDGSRMHRYGSMAVIAPDGTLRRFDPAAWSPRVDGAYLRGDRTMLVHPGSGDHAFEPQEWTVDAAGTMLRSDGGRVVFADGDEWSFAG